VLLLTHGWERRYHGEERVDGREREPAAGQRNADARKVGGGDRDDALDPRMEPHDTDPAQALFGRNAEEWEGEAVERMGRLSNLDRVDWECGEA